MALFLLLWSIIVIESISMAGIHLTTFIAAPLPRVFNLSRNISIYKKIFSPPKELFESSSFDNHLTLGDSVSMQTRHAWRYRSVTLKITSFQQPWYYTEEMIKGDLICYRHEHHFKEVENGSIMIDMVSYDFPNDIIGKLIGSFYMKTYIENLVHSRNLLITEYAESEKWRVLIAN